jgi:hypothetical protein
MVLALRRAGEALSTSSFRCAIDDNRHHVPEEIYIRALLEKRLQVQSVDWHSSTSDLLHFKHESSAVRTMTVTTS